MSDEKSQRAEHTVVYFARPGEVLDERWLIEDRIGQGAMGSVFRGQDLKRKQRVAIKILSPEHCRKPKVVARFEREARLMTTLRHPNIVQLHGVGRRGALPYIVMQYLEGVTLAEYLKQKGGKLGPAETLAVVRQVCSGLSFIHHHGLVHRDIKPQNIFIGADLHATILDLGVVRDKSAPGLTKPGAMVGTPYYMSPEQIQNTTEIDRRTDVYALGAVIFELLTGAPPFVAESNFEVLYKHRTMPPPDASLVSSTVPKEAAQVIIRALAKHPDERQQNVHELLHELEAAYCLDSERTHPSINAFVPAEKKRPLKKPAPAEPKKIEPGVGKDGRISPRAFEPTMPVDLAKVQERSRRHSREVKKTEPLPPPVPEASLPESPPARKPRTTSGEAPLISSAEIELVDAGDDFPQGPADDPAQTDLRGARDSHDTANETLADREATVVEQGELRVVTTVKGLTSPATLVLNKEPKGNTPASLVVAAGTHSLRLERAGFKPVERQVQVKANGVTLLRVELEPAK